MKGDRNKMGYACKLSDSRELKIIDWAYEQLKDTYTSNKIRFRHNGRVNDASAVMRTLYLSKGLYLICAFNLYGNNRNCQQPSQLIFDKDVERSHICEDRFDEVSSYLSGVTDDDKYITNIVKVLYDNTKLTVNYRVTTYSSYTYTNLGSFFVYKLIY